MSTVIVRSREGLRQEIEIGRHRIVADEPIEAGGTDAGPGPYDLLAAALGACKSMTMRLYAARKGWPLEGVSVRVAHARIHARDCEACETKEGMLDRFDCVVELYGPLSAEQRERLAEIAERCPVHRTLTAEIEIITALSG
jgi:putative redox protein